MKRTTRQREAILKCLTEKNRPLTIEELLEITLQEISTINLSTIYRNLKSLKEEGKIQTINVANEKPRYELVNHEHYHHFLCDQCHKIFNIQDCPSGLQKLVPEGFHLVGHSITLNGFCAQCLDLKSAIQ